MTVELVLPTRSDDDISEGLVRITAALVDHMEEPERCFGLGGENGYGENFENDVFMMHRYCWCDGYDCPWCSYSKEHGHHFQERFREFGAVPGDLYQGAPNFWHKPSGLKVWWYKYIGRDNEIAGGKNWSWDEIERDCLASLKKETA